LGDGVSVRFPGDLVSAAEAVFRRSDPTFQFQECPLEITIDGQTRLLPGGGGEAAFAAWEVTVFRGLRPGFPGTDESVAIYRPSLCSESGANASAQLMVDGLSMED
jgi:hypothetical protein